MLSLYKWPQEVSMKIGHKTIGPNQGCHGGLPVFLLIDCQSIDSNQNNFKMVVNSV